MIRSMTGFGRAEIKNERYEVSAEIRCLNNRYLDIGIRLPKSLASYELILKELVKKNVYRGKISLNVNLKNSVLSNGNLVINEESVKNYTNLLGQLKNHAGIPGEIKLDHLLLFKELIEPEEITIEDKEVEKLLSNVVTQALDDLNEMREKEAQNLGKDILHRVQKIEKFRENIYKKGKINPRSELDKLYKRLKDLIGANEIDKDRLELELAMIADKVDITEECMRLKSHIDLFRDVYENKKEVGKQLTFILQEMLREINTVGSKTTDISVSHAVISVKEEIEKLREQIQNLE